MGPSEMLARLRAVPDIGDFCIRRWDEEWGLYEDRPSSWRKTRQGAIREAELCDDKEEPIISVAVKASCGWTCADGVPLSVFKREGLST